MVHRVLLILYLDLGMYFLLKLKRAIFIQISCARILRRCLITLLSQFNSVIINKGPLPGPQIFSTRLIGLFLQWSLGQRSKYQARIKTPKEPHDNSLLKKKRDSRPDGKNTNHTECKSHAKEEKSRRSQSIEIDIGNQSIHSISIDINRRLLSTDVSNR